MISASYPYEYEYCTRSKQSVSDFMSEIAGERVPHTGPDNHRQFNEIASLFIQIHPLQRPRNL